MREVYRCVHTYVTVLEKSGARRRERAYEEKKLKKLLMKKEHCFFGHGHGSGETPMQGNTYSGYKGIHYISGA